MLTLLLFINLTTLYSILKVIFDWEYFNLLGLKILIVFLMVIVAVVNYKYFTFEQRYRDLLTHHHLNKVNLVTGVVVFCSLFVLFLTWFLIIVF
jgi:hypothetical protein